MEILEINPIQRECRICLGVDVEMNCLFEKKYNELSLAELLREYTSVELEDTGALISSTVCGKCTLIITNFNDLMLLFKVNEQFLKSKVESDFKSDQVKGENDSVSNDCEGEESDGFDCKSEMLAQTESENIGNIEIIVEDMDDEVTSENDCDENSDIDTNCSKYTCDVCGDCFLLKSGFQRHMFVKHDKHLQEHETDWYCSKITAKIPIFFPKNSTSFKEEKQVTNKQSTLQCKICFESFFSQCDLVTHQEIHKTFTCEICGTSFIKKAYLREHRLVHDDEKRYKCQECGKSFSHRSSFRRHKFTHASREFVCDSCGQSFKQKQNLDVHIQAKHLKEKNYHCTKCDLSFTVKSWLDKHFLRTHTTRKKDFVCSECGRSYLEKATLKRHISEKHSGKTLVKHTCNVCEKTFVEKRRLLTHLKNKHS